MTLFSFNISNNIIFLIALLLVWNFVKIGTTRICSTMLEFHCSVALDGTMQVMTLKLS